MAPVTIAAFCAGAGEAETGVGAEELKPQEYDSDSPGSFQELRRRASTSRSRPPLLRRSRMPSTRGSSRRRCSHLQRRLD